MQVFPEVQFKIASQKSGVTHQPRHPTNFQMHCEHLFFIKNPAVSGKLDFFGGASRWIVAKTSIKSSFIVNLSVLKASVNVLCGHDDLVDHSDHCISQHSLQIWWWWWVSVTSSTKISTIIPIGSMNAHREYCLWLTWTSEAKHELFMSVHPFNPHWF